MSKIIVIAANLVIANGKVLCIKRINEPYKGFWAFPGGKVEIHEHIKDAALRELKEETGIDAEFLHHEAVFSEIMKENNNVLYHFIVHVCAVSPKTTMINMGNEGEVQWLDIATIDPKSIIPTDLKILKNAVEKKQNAFYEWTIEKKGEKYFFSQNNDVSSDNTQDSHQE